jgi:transcriptional regulator with XRE-family HTH domain
MPALLLSGTMEETRGQAAKRRRATLGVARDVVAHEAGVSVKTVKSYEEDARQNMPSGARIEEALDRLEGQRDTPQRRRASDTPKRRIIDAAIEADEGEVVVRVFDDGTRAIFLVPPGAAPPTDEQVRQTLREVRGEN